ncbi:MAG: D-hexose-6-phosphate mutarotase [Sulfurimonadaceae bacterium]|nr:D-hexose-6-phosphate mutarotase [Sulfurimonadaceae bacterium]
MRGGIPICWPWFGLQPGRVQHGFARKSLWTLFGTTVNGRGETVLRLGLQESESSREHFPYAFVAEYSITVGKSLSLELKTTNSDEKAFELSQALHTYFAVDSIDNVAIEGFEGINYIDTLENNAICTQEGPITINAEVDRIYVNDRPTSLLSDGKRRIEISKTGSRSSVVWNPWIGKAASMADFEDEGYRHMVCIETANAASDTRTLQPGDSHTVTQRIALI